MTYEEVVTLFRYIYKTRYITECQYAQHIIKKHNISSSTILRWKKQGFDKTIEKSFGYCKTCNIFFMKTTSTQILCGSRECLLQHNNYMAKHNNYNKARKKPISEFSLIKKKAKRQVSLKRAVRNGKPYSEKELLAIKNRGKKTLFEVAIELGRSVASVEYASSKLL